ncbi:type III-B CRISPR module RAMP protein Cmr4 [Melghirimyces algeriensis]|uniref:CRISPR-associated protein, Cmr4 family n=1 Tax=Melghirimyces algeriensis TaxID=910412 RepID=A0A521AP77_9BACL|nr:type III-B CRISPR module RAMP protein Cmr4 [Melghirimyces algeriensis]SMO36440.1 CRISPR-associated protein, Cmr4 family [Melghirimyces algeriensis]
MKAKMIGLLTETMMHPGSGQHNGAIDLPVARESTTGYPVVVGSSMKGALRDKMIQEDKKKEASRWFGEQEHAGLIAVTDARLLLLPVRSLQGVYRWVTCPYILERLERDASMIGHSMTFQKPQVHPEQAVVADQTEGLFLEELSFQTRTDAELMEDLTRQIAPLIGHQEVCHRLKEQLAIVSNHDFAHLARYSLPVQIRNQLSAEKTSQNLWSEETLPVDTVLYTLLMLRPGGKDCDLSNVMNHLKRHRYIQMGGNETIGQGWCLISADGWEGA